MKKLKFLFMVIVMAGYVGMVGATVVDISVATDKEIYQLNEEVTVFVTAYNPNQESVTLGFGSSLTTTYLMDGVFNWSQGKVFNPSGLLLTIEANESFTWDITHGSKEMNLYALDFGVHSVVGEVVGYGLSEAVEFEVIPEPATVVLFGSGFICIRWNTRKRPVNRNCSILFKNLKQIRESRFRLYPAGLCPGNEFRDVHPSVGGFAVVDIALRFTEYFSNLTLRKSRILPELPQIAGNQSVFHAMLRFCRHVYEFSTKTS